MNLDDPASGNLGFERNQMGRGKGKEHNEFGGSLEQQRGLVAAEYATVDQHDGVEPDSCPVKALQREEESGKLTGTPQKNPEELAKKKAEKVRKDKERREKLRREDPQKALDQKAAAAQKRKEKRDIDRQQRLKNPEELAKKKAEKVRKDKERREKLRREDPQKALDQKAAAAQKRKEKRDIDRQQRLKNPEELAKKKAEKVQKDKERREKLRREDPQKALDQKAAAARNRKENRQQKLTEASSTSAGHTSVHQHVGVESDSCLVKALQREKGSEKLTGTPQKNPGELAKEKAEKVRKAKERREKVRREDPQKALDQKAEAARKRKEKREMDRQQRLENPEELAKKKAEKVRKDKERREKLRRENPQKALDQKAGAAQKRKEKRDLDRQQKRDKASLTSAGHTSADQHVGVESHSCPVNANQREDGSRKRKRQSSSSLVWSADDQPVGRSDVTPTNGRLQENNVLLRQGEHTNNSSKTPVHAERETPGTPARMPPQPRKNVKRVLFPATDTSADGAESIQSDLLKRKMTYFEKIRKGPTTVCSCCGGLFYSRSIYKIDKPKLQSWKLSDEKIRAILFVDQNPHWLCGTCKDTARDRKVVPTLALSNGLDFPPIPSVLKDLTRLEQRLVSPKVPFMQIKLLGFEQQWTLRGNVVNVENDLDCCMKCLPRQFREACVVQLKLMRRMHYNSPYIYDKIRPAIIMAAMNYLLKTPLYKEDGVTLSEDWTFPANLDEVEFNFDEDDEETPNNDENVPEEGNEAMDEVIEDDDNNGVVDDDQTLLFQDDVAELGIKIAPAEGNQPRPFYKDPKAELLSFPKIYCGQSRNIKQGVKLSYTFLVRSELRRSDRRCANPEKILYSFKKLYNEKVRDAYQICVRQKPASFGGKNITAGMLRNDASVQKLLAKDDGYAVYKQVRCTPAYWKEQCKKVVAMIRQLGPCSLFITLSAAESRWGELLVILKKVVDNENVREEEALLLSSQERARLVRSDPVTCMRHFDNKYKEFYSKLVKPEAGIFRPYGVEDRYSRIEYQMRGSPHSHGMYWMKGAPTYDPNDAESAEKCIEFIDKFITCKRDTEGEMKDLIGYQLHRHTHTCKKGKRSTRTCRFHIPRPPLRETMILKPLPKETLRPDRERLTQLYTQVENELNNLGRMYEGEMEVEDFLNMLGVSYDSYLEAIRSSIKRTTVFLRRKPKEAFVNAYNRDILVTWKANMDIQFVLDGYACAKYVATYISGGGVSKLLRAAAADVKDGNSKITNKLERFGAILINSSEISAQEAAAFCLGMDMTECTRTDVFANTSVASTRIKMTKPKADLEKLADDSEDIYVKGSAYRYSKRPEDMEDVCFAEFLTWWEPVSGKTRKEDNSDVTPSIMIDTSENEDDDEGHEAVNLDSEAADTDATRYRTRKKAKILRFCNFSRVTAAEDYWREQLMLFVPWRDEQRDILDKGDFEEEAKSNEAIILTNSKEYYNARKFAASLDDERVHINLEEVIDDVLAENDSTPAIDRENLTREEDMMYTSETITGKVGKKVDMFLPPKQIENDKYYDVMRSLNTLQRRFVLEILHRLKTGGEPFHVFLSGGAGVGKSHVITAIVQSFLRFSNQLQKVNPDSLPVIVCAPTGKAAFNVFGMTMHNVFRLPPMQYAGPLAPLEEGVANTLRVRYRETDLFIIDEISMCGSTQFQRIDARLRQLFDRGQPFGGKSILAVGHLRQLPPVGEKIIFKCPNLGGPESARTPLVGRNPLWKLFSYFELTEIMRQRNAYRFCKALNNMSEGTMDADDIELIRSREVCQSAAPKDAVWLFVTNKECEEYNHSLHTSLGTESVVSIAVDSVTGNASEAEKRQFAAEAQNFNRQENMGLLPIVNLQVGAIYFVTSNIDVADGLFNGATGILRGIEKRTMTSTTTGAVVLTAWIEFCHPSIGQKVRSLASHSARVQKLNFNKEWTPIDPISRILTRKRNGMQVTRNQVPVQPANGMTIAKAQGSSLPRVVISLKPRIRRENLYVACSRATNLEELYIVGNFVAPTCSDMSDPVTQEMEVLNNSKLDFKLRFPEDYSAVHTIYYHNVEGFLVHREDILNDKNIMGHQYLVFVEPRIRPTDSVSLEGFTLCFRKDSTFTKGQFRNGRFKNGKWTKGTHTAGFCNSEGILVFKKDNLPQVDFELKASKQDKSHCILLTSIIGGKRLIFVYRHPRFPKSKFLGMMADELREPRSSKRVVVTGDMNYDLKDPSTSVVEFMRGLNLHPNLPVTTSTTNYNTHLDVCFSDMSDLVAGVYETYYSYHKALSVYW